MSQPGVRRRPFPVRLVQFRPRLFLSISVVIVLATALLAVSRWPRVTCLLVAWDVGISVYIALVFHLMSDSGLDDIRRRAAQEDEGKFGILALTVVAALASLAAIFVELGTNGGRPVERTMSQLLLAALTILLSWTLIHTIFALHYAHEFYDDVDSRGMDFPGGENEPDYWDFVYFSFVIGMTSQVSDVGVTSKVIRRTVAAHGVVSFLFNAALLALTVNIAASAI